MVIAASLARPRNAARRGTARRCRRVREVREVAPQHAHVGQRDECLHARRLHVPGVACNEPFQGADYLAGEGRVLYDDWPKYA